MESIPTSRCEFSDKLLFDRPALHSEITGRNTKGSIMRNIAKATELGVPLRVGVISVKPDQDIAGAVSELKELGVHEEHIGIDYLRQVGRGIRDGVAPETATQLCGNCANGVVAVMPDGRVQPCVFSRQAEFTIGNVNGQTLGSVLSSDRFITVRGLLRGIFAERLQDKAEIPVAPRDGRNAPAYHIQPSACNPVAPPCPPDCLLGCWPGCQPNCAPSCSPACIPMNNCNPVYR